MKQDTSRLAWMTGVAVVACGLSLSQAFLQAADLEGVNHGLIAVGRFPADQFDRLGDKVDTMGGYFSGMHLDVSSVGYAGDTVTGVVYGLTDRGWSVGGGAVTYDYHPRIQKFNFSIRPYLGSGPIAPDRITLENTASQVFTANGKPMTGYDSDQLPAPAVPTSSTNSPGGGRLSLDSEGIVRAADGGWFVADEYGPVVHRFNAAGELQQTFLPPEAFLPKRGNYPATLNWTGASAPASGRRNNRGFEGMTLTPDGKRLVTVLQSPLVQDGGRANNSENSRVVVFDVADGSPTYGQVIAEYVYPLTLKGSAQGNRQTILSEILAINHQTFLVSERDALGYGSGDTNPPVYKRIVLISTAEASNIANTGYDLERGAPGMLALPTNGLPSNIKPVLRKDLVDLLEPAGLAKYGINNTASDSNSMTEKWEGLGLIPKGDPAAKDDYYLMIGSDNDLTASVVYHNGIPVATNDFTVDTYLFAFHVTIPGVGAPAPANVLPTVAFTGPTQPTLSGPARVDLDVTAYDADGKVVRVEFFEGATKLGEDTTFPFSLRLEGVVAGVHGYRAVCHDNSGATGEGSTTVTVTVENIGPTVQLTAPASGAYGVAGATQTLTVKAADADGYIKQVEYRVNGTALGVSTSSPFSLNWTNVPSGVYSIVAVVTDNQGATASSVASTWTVLPKNVVQPNTVVAGKKQSEWSAAWWQWVLNQVADDHHPLKDPEGDDGWRGQSGSVWFLGGIVNVSGTAVRDIVVPAGKSLFFPVINVECSTVEPPPYHGGNEAELKACAEGFVRKDLFCTIDGQAVPNLDAYLVTSPMFDFTLPENNILGLPAGPGSAVDNGTYIMLSPLSPGEHVLHYGGAYATDPPFVIDITYRVTVLPAGVLPPSAEVAGLTQAEWGAAWWQWALSQGTNTSPLLDLTGGNANARQYGDVFFLAGVLGYQNVSNVTRTFTVPAGKHLFFPIVNSAADNIDVFPPVPESQLRAWTAGFIDTTKDLLASVDGVAVSNVKSFRQKSPMYGLVLPKDNVFQPLSPGYADGVVIEDGVTDGYWVMTEPLAPGKHTVVFGASGDGGFHINITNVITVVPHPVIPLAETYLGKTYAQWAEEWWMCIASIQYTANPLFDTTGQFGHIGQKGPVWFLPGTTGATVTRDLTVPYGKSLFFPLVNFGNDYPCPDPSFKPAEGQTLEDFLKQGADDLVKGITNLFAVIDGVNVTNLFAQRVTSPMFNFTGNISLRDMWDSCITGTEQQVVVDGYWLLLPPLSPGVHILKFGGKHVSFGVDVTYRLTVLPPGVLAAYEPLGGVTQEEHTARWWTWASEQTRAINPLLDVTGVNANNGQRGSVYYLGGTFGSTDDPTVPGAVRHFRVPAGKPLFFPMLNGENDNATYDPDVSVEQLGADLKLVMDNPIKLVASVDGVTVPNALTRRLVAPPFAFTLPSDNIYHPLDDRYTDGLRVDPATADGYWLALEPLSPGTHVLDYGGRVRSGFATAVRAFVTVVPEGEPFISRLESRATEVVVQFWTGKSGSYRVESAASLSGPWQGVGGVVPADAEQHQVTLPKTAALQFYRIRGE